MNKIKRILTGLLIALAGGLLAIILYVKLVGVTDHEVLIRESTPIQLMNQVAVASPQVQLPDLTKAAEKSVHAVVHIKVKMKGQSDEGDENSLFDFFFGPRGRG